MFGNLFDSVVDAVEGFVDDPVGTAIDVATQPIVDGCDLLQGLTEGEFRHKAAMRLGTDVVAGMAVSEIIEALSE